MLIICDLIFCIEYKNGNKKIRLEIKRRLYSDIKYKEKEA
jgi:hypothetical protein